MPEPSTKHFERLPKSVVPKNYDLWLKPDLKKLDYEGKVTVQVEVKEVINKIILNAAGVIIDNVEYKDGLAKSQSSTSVELIESDQICKITFAEPLSLGPGELAIQFHRELDDSMKGFYKSKYITPSGEERYAAVTQFEPTDARRAFPCWDEPTLKATFDVTLVVQKDRLALSNMNVISDVPYGPNNQLREVKFAKTPIMSTYLLAVVVGEFDFIEALSADGVLVRIYTPLGKKEQGTYALEVATKCLPFYKDYFNIAYPLPKLDLIAIPDFAAGAMENWGLVTYREVCLLVDPQNTAHEAKERIALTVAHEIAHQWFGNLVTMEWWTHLWLNEGFASFMEFLAVDHIFPDYHIWSHFVIHQYNDALNSDALSNSHPIEVPVGHPDEVDEIFDSISYHKGSSVIRMLHKFIGDDAFRKGMNLYLTKHAYSNTVTEDLWSALEQASGKPVTAVMSTWTRQMGFPVIQVSSKQDGENQLLILSQEKYVSDGVVDKTNGYQWMVPISIITPLIPEEKAQLVLLDTHQTEVLVKASKNDWIKLNPGIVGFYRVQYSEEMMTKLLPAIENHSLPLMDRLGLQNDLFAMVKAGRKSTVEVLKLMEAYTTETNYTVWRTLANCLSTLSVIISHTDFDSLFHMYCQKFFAKIHAKLGWEPIQGESHLDNMLRSLVITQLAGADDKAVLEEASRRFEAHVNGKSILPADLRRPVYRAAAKAGDDKTFEKLMKLYHEADLQEEKVRISMALGGFREKTKLSKALEFSMSSDVRSQDTIYVIMSVSANKNGRDLAWNFFKDRKDDFLSRYKGGFLISKLVSCIAEDFASEDKALEIESFFANNHFPATDRTVLQALETIRLNAKWLNRDKDAIYNFLSSRQ